MVVAASTTPNLKSNPSVRSHSNPKRPPLLPSERDNNNNNVSVPPNRRPKSREVSSRYLSTSSSTSTSNSSSSTLSNSSSSYLSNSRRCPSPIPSRTSLAPTTPAPIKRSLSVERRRPATPRPRNVGDMSAAAKMLVNSTRSLSVSFQGESLAVKTAKRAPSPSVRATTATVTPRKVGNGNGNQGGENARQFEHHQPWPGRSRPLSMSSLSKSVDLGSSHGKKLINGSTKVVRALQESLTTDSCGGGGSESFVSDTESASSGSQESSTRSSSKGEGGRSIVVPARVWQEANSRLRRGSEPGSPMARNSSLMGAVPPKLIAPRKFINDSPVPSPRGALCTRGFSSPLRGAGSVRPASPSRVATPRPASPNVRPASPSRVGTPRPASPNVRPASPSRPVAARPASPRTVRPASPGKVGPVRPASPSKLGTSMSSERGSLSRGMASPSRVRNAVAGAFANSATSTQSVLSFGADVRRVKVGDNRLGDAHLLRLLHNRHLQWRFVNARAEASLCIQKTNAEKSLYNAWKKTSDLRGVVSSKRKELQWLRQKLKLVSILKGQMLYLEEWALMDKDHCSSLSGAAESLKASIIRLPVIGGARADIQDMKDAICSAADVMQVMAPSICSLLSKLEEANSLVAEVAGLTLKEQSLLNECKEILSTLATMQVKDCSLRAHILQLKSEPSSLAVQV